MKRREFITLLGGAAAWPVVASAQQTMPVIGLLGGAGLESASVMAAFRQGLAEAGYIEGRNLATEVRSAEGHYDRLPALAGDLVRRQVAVIATITPVAALAAKAATATIPIVFELGSDPVKDGLVASLNRPGGNVTGVTFFTNLLSSKRLQLLHELVPDATRVAMLLNPSNANAELERHETETAARALGLEFFAVRASTESEIEAAFAGIVQLGATAGADRLDAGRQWGTYVGRILKGEKPADMPVVLPTKFKFVINLTVAKALGLDVPLSLQQRAEEVIE